MRSGGNKFWMRYNWLYGWRAGLPLEYRSMFVRGAALAALMSSIAANAAQPQLEPRRQWVAYFEDNMCVLQREYGSPVEPLTLAFKPQPMSDSYTAFVFSSAKRRDPGFVPAKLQFGTGPDPIERQILNYYVPKLKSRVAEFGVSREELNRAAASELISIDAKGRVKASFKVPGFSKALGVLDECVTDLLATWGLSREQQKAMVKWPQPVKPIIEYVHAADYPMEALRNDQTGWNSARYRIDAHGLVSDCRIVESSGSSALDATLCRLVGRFRYHPAADHSGKPVDSLGFVRFRWQIG